MESSSACVAVLDPQASNSDLAEVLIVASDVKLGAQLTRGDGWVAVPIGDTTSPATIEAIERLPCVLRVVPTATPYRLASREVFAASVGVSLAFRDDLNRVRGIVELGGEAPLGLIVSSPWVSGNDERLQLLAPLLRELGCRIFHAGQMSLSPTSDVTAGLSEYAVGRLRDVAHASGLALGVEVTDASQIVMAESLADVLQIGSQNMQDFSLLREVGRAGVPVLLRRGAGATVEEFLLAAEYVLLSGNGRVILCESGIRTFDAVSKPRFEINAIPLIRQLTHLPLMADPSQAAPSAAAVPAMAKAAIAAGADGMVLEVVPDVRKTNELTIELESARRLVGELQPIARAVGRTASTPTVGHDPMLASLINVLHNIDRPLGQTIGAIVGAPPILEVISQWELAPPHASWLSPPLSPDSRVLARCTSYRVGRVNLSWNISYVDLGRIDPALASSLKKEDVNLGQLFTDPRTEGLEYEFGTQEDDGEIDEIFHQCVPKEFPQLNPYVWRRYKVSIAGIVTCIVVEALPVQVWDEILASQSGRLLLDGGSE